MRTFKNVMVSSLMCISLALAPAALAAAQDYVDADADAGFSDAPLQEDNTGRTESPADNYTDPRPESEAGASIAAGSSMEDGTDGTGLPDTVPDNASESPCMAGEEIEYYENLYAPSFPDALAKRKVYLAGLEPAEYDPETPYNEVWYIFCDLYNDGVKEMLVASMAGEDRAYLCVYSYDGSTIQFLGDGEIENPIHIQTVAGYEGRILYLSTREGAHLYVSELFNGTYRNWKLASLDVDEYSGEDISDFAPYLEFFLVSDITGDWITYNGNLEPDSGEVNGAEPDTGTAELHLDDDHVYRVYKNGVFDPTYTGLIEFEGGTFFVASGLLCQTAQGLNLYNGTWYFLSNGQVQKQHSGFAEYDSHWFMIRNGLLDTGANGIYFYNNGLFAFAGGQLKSEINGLWQNPVDQKWYFLSQGQIQTQFSGVAAYDGHFFVVKGGEFQSDYNGTIEYEGEIFKVTNGELTTPVVDESKWKKAVYDIKADVTGDSVTMTWKHDGGADQFGIYEVVKGKSSFVKAVKTTTITLEQVSAGTHVYIIRPRKRSDSGWELGEKSDRVEVKVASQDPQAETTDGGYEYMERFESTDPRNYIYLEGNKLVVNGALKRGSDYGDYTETLSYAKRSFEFDPDAECYEVGESSEGAYVNEITLDSLKENGWDSTTHYESAVFFTVYNGKIVFFEVDK